MSVLAVRKVRPGTWQAMRHRAIRVLLPWGGLACLFAVYFSLRPLGNHVSDSYAWVNTVEQDAFEYFYHPHHLLYVPLAWWWTNVVHLFEPTADTWACMAALSAVFGCSGLAAVYSTLRLLGTSMVSACGGSLLVAFGFGYWFFSSDAEVYVVSLSFALWSFYFMARLAKSGALREAWWSGVTAGLAALFHQTGIFLFVPAFVVCAGLAAGMSRFLRVGVFAAAFGVVVAPAYLVCAWSALPSLSASAFVKWLFLFAGEGYGGFSVSGIMRAPIGLARGFVGGQMALDMLRGAAAPGVVGWIGIALGILAAGGLAFVAWRGLRSVRRLSRPAAIMCVCLLAAFLVYAVFGAYFDPVNFEWWTIPAALFSCALALASLTVAETRSMSVFATVALLFAANLILDFQYRRNPWNDVLKVAADGVLAVSGEEDVIVAPSYLGVVLWREAPGRRVFCPEEATRISGPGGARSEFERISESESGRRRVVVVGAEADHSVRDFVRDIIPSKAEDEKIVIGHVPFFNGRRGLVERVGVVPITAFGGSERRVALQ